MADVQVLKTNRIKDSERQEDIYANSFTLIEQSFVKSTVDHDMTILQIFELSPIHFREKLGVKVKAIKYSMESFVKGVKVGSKLVKFGDHRVENMQFDDVIKLLESNQKIKTATWSTYDAQKAEALAKAQFQDNASNASARGEEFGCKHLRKLNKIFEFRPAYSSGGKEIGAIVTAVNEAFLNYAKDVTVGDRILIFGKLNVEEFTFDRIMQKIAKGKKKMQVTWERLDEVEEVCADVKITENDQTSSVPATGGNLPLFGGAALPLPGGPAKTQTSDALPLPVGSAKSATCDPLPLPQFSDNSKVNSKPQPLPLAKDSLSIKTPSALPTPAPLMKDSISSVNASPSSLPTVHESLTNKSSRTSHMIEEEVQAKPDLMVHDSVDDNIDYDLAFLTAHPLCVNYDSKKKVLPPLLEFEQEQNLLMEVCESASQQEKIRVRYMHSVGTSGNFTNIILKNTKMLHYSGNGSEQQLLLETSCAAGNVGETNPVGIDELAVLTKEGGMQFIFVSSQCAEQIGELFSDCGVPHIVTLTGKGARDSAFAQEFIRSFYSHIFAGKSVEFAFMTAKRAVASFKNYANRLDKMVSLLPEGEDHSICLYPKGDRSNLLHAKFKNLSPIRGRDLNLGDGKNFVGRERLRMDVLKSVLTNKIVILQGPYGVGKSELLRFCGHYLIKRRMFMQGVFFFKFQPDQEEPDTLSLATCLDNQLSELYDKNSMFANIPRKRVRHWLRLQTQNISGKGLLILFDDIEKLLLPNHSCTFISLSQQRKNLSFLLEMISLKGVRVCTTASDARLEQLLFENSLSPIPIHIFGMTISDSLALLYLNLEKRNVDSDIMETLYTLSRHFHQFLELHVCEQIQVHGKISDEARCRPSRLKHVAIDLAERLSRMAQGYYKFGETELLEQLEQVRGQLRRKFLDFWVGDLCNTQQATSKQILNKLDLYIKRNCNTIDRGIFWTIWDPEMQSVFQRLNDRAKEELEQNWLHNKTTWTREIFRNYWEERFHSLEAEINHFGPDLWQKPGAIAGFWEKKSAQRFIETKEVGTFIIRLSRTFRHHVNIMCQHERRTAKILLGLQQNGRTRTISEGKLYDDFESEPMENFISNSPEFMYVYNDAMQKLQRKQSLFTRQPAIDPNRQDYCCCNEVRSGGAPKRSKIMQDPKPKLHSGHSSRHGGSRHGSSHRDRYHSSSNRDRHHSSNNQNNSRRDQHHDSSNRDKGHRYHSDRRREPNDSFGRFSSSSSQHHRSDHHHHHRTNPEFHRNFSSPVQQHHRSDHHHPANPEFYRNSSSPSTRHHSHRKRQEQSSNQRPVELYNNNIPEERPAYASFDNSSVHQGDREEDVYVSYDGIDGYSKDVSIRRDDFKEDVHVRLKNSNGMDYMSVQKVKLEETDSSLEATDFVLRKDFKISV